MRNLTPVITSLFLVGLAACASAHVAPVDPIASLEQQQHAKPTSAAVNRSLGIAYFQAKRYAEARVALETATKLDPRDGTASLYLGLTDEALGDLPAAKTAYSSYIQFGRTSRVRGQLQARLAALARTQLAADARAAVQQESALAGEPGPRTTIAVLPLHFSGADSTLKPLERGFADLLTTDLARSSQLTLVERSRMQAILDELKLQAGGATEGASNVRFGKLVRAGRVVQGSLLQLDNTNLRVDAAVVDVPTSQVQGVSQQSDQLEAVFALEKKLALDLFTQLGVTLTVAERNAIESRPTRSLAAFVSYSNGLTAEDEGRYDDAGRFFNEAVRLDPGFGAAQQKSAEVKTVSAGAAVTAATVESSLKGTSEGAVVTASTQGSAAPPGSSAPGLGSTAQSTAGDLNPSATGTAAGAGPTSNNGSAPGARDPASSGTGTDNPSNTARVTIVITRPKSP